MIYILHFKKPLSHAKHYVGYCRRGRLGERLQEHRSGAGAKILVECNRQGISYKVVRMVAGNREIERKIKLAKNTPRFCPICNPDYEPKKMNLS